MMNNIRKERERESEEKEKQTKQKRNVRREMKNKK